MYSLGSMGGVRLGVLIQILEGYLVVGVVFFGGGSSVLPWFKALKLVPTVITG